MPEQRAFSPEEVATMLGMDRATVSSLLRKGELGNKEIGDLQRIFLSDLEDYLGEERARSLVREINRDDGDARRGRSESGASESTETSGVDFHVEVLDESEAEPRRRGRGRRSRYEPVVQKWNEIDEDNEAIVLGDLSETDVQNVKNLLYRRIGAENVIVRSAEQRDGKFKAIVRAREGNEYLRE